MTYVNYASKPFEASFNSFVDDLFTDLPALFKNDFNKTERKGFVPVNVKETANSYQLDVVAPGFEKTDFRINLDQQLLTISVENKEETKKDNAVPAPKEKLIRKEYSYSSFKRSFTIDEKIDATKITASYINGILILNLPKKEEVNVSPTEIVIN